MLAGYQPHETVMYSDLKISLDFLLFKFIYSLNILLRTLFAFTSIP